MRKIGFNAQAFVIARYQKSSGMSHAVADCAFERAMVFRPGIDPIKEGLRLTDKKGFKNFRGEPLTGDVDS